MVTITRIAGLKIGGQIDSIWSSYFLIVAAQIGIILASISSYQTLFVSYRRGNIHKAERGTRIREHYLSSTKELMKRVFIPSPWRSKARGQSTPDEYKEGQYSHRDVGDLPTIPRAHMTGVRTFINGHGQGMHASHIMESQKTQDDDGDWPLPQKDHNPENNV